jgi:hypothetical protein
MMEIENQQAAERRQLQIARAAMLKSVANMATPTNGKMPSHNSSSTA